MCAQITEREYRILSPLFALEWFKMLDCLNQQDIETRANDQLRSVSPQASEQCKLRKGFYFTIQDRAVMHFGSPT